MQAHPSQFNSNIVKPRIIEDPKTHKFESPEKRIKTQQEMEAFSKSTQYAEYMSFVCALQESVISKGISESTEKLNSTKNGNFKIFSDFFDSLRNLVEEVELLPKNQARFGNPAFKTWHEKAMETGNQFFDSFLDEERKNSKIELMCYFSDSFGSNVRIDYGTGHEMNFAILMLCLVKLGYFEESEYELMVRGIFYK